MARLEARARAFWRPEGAASQPVARQHHACALSQRRGRNSRTHLMNTALFGPQAGSCQKRADAFVAVHPNNPDGFDGASI